VRDGTIRAPLANWWRVGFQDEKDTGQFIHVGVNVKSGEVVAYEDSDRAELLAAGCSLT
jgi:hypothetical protein